MRGLELGMPNRQLPSPAITTLMNLLVYKLTKDRGAIMHAIFLGGNGRRRRSRDARNGEIGRRLLPPEFVAGLQDLSMPGVSVGIMEEGNTLNLLI